MSMHKKVRYEVLNPRSLIYNAHEGTYESLEDRCTRLKQPSLTIGALPNDLRPPMSPIALSHHADA